MPAGGLVGDPVVDRLEMFLERLAHGAVSLGRPVSGEGQCLVYPHPAPGPNNGAGVPFPRAIHQPYTPAITTSHPPLTHRANELFLALRAGDAVDEVLGGAVDPAVDGDRLAWRVSWSGCWSQGLQECWGCGEEAKPVTVDLTADCGVTYWHISHSGLSHCREGQKNKL